MCLFLYGATAVMGYRRWRGSGQFRRYRLKNSTSSRGTRSSVAWWKGKSLLKQRSYFAAVTEGPSATSDTTNEGPFEDIMLSHVSPGASGILWRIHCIDSWKLHLLCWAHCIAVSRAEFKRNTWWCKHPSVGQFDGYFFPLKHLIARASPISKGNVWIIKKKWRSVHVQAGPPGAKTTATEREYFEILDSVIVEANGQRVFHHSSISNPLIFNDRASVLGAKVLSQSYFPYMVTESVIRPQAISCAGWRPVYLRRQILVAKYEYIFPLPDIK